MIYIASDHAGFKVKEKMIGFFETSGIEYIDLGPEAFEKEDDYPDFAFRLGEEVVNENAKGILICRSGIGMTIAANKVLGVRAAYIESKEHARRAREEDDVNIFIFDTLTFDPEKDFEIVEILINTPFTNIERYQRRINKIREYEQK